MRRKCINVLIAFAVSSVTASAGFANQPNFDWRGIPSPVKTAFLARAPNATVRHVQQQTFDKIEKQLYRFKAYSLADGGLMRLCFDGEGAFLADCGRGLREAEAGVYYQDYGAIDPALWARMTATPMNQAIPVGIWLATFEPVLARSASSQSLSAHAASIASMHSATKQQLVTSMADTTGKVPTLVPNAPAAFAMLTRAEIIALAKVPPIAALYYYPAPVPQATAYVSAVNADISGETGSGAKVCVIEASQPETPNNLATASGTYCSTGSKDKHARCVNAIIDSTSSPYGVATDASMYRASWDGCDSNASAAFNWCVGTYSTVWNWSHTCSPTDNRLFDYWTKASPYPLIVAAAGNTTAGTMSCGSSCSFTSPAPVTSCTGYSTLLVGAANDCGTSSRSDDEIACFSYSGNPSSSDRELPMLVAPGQNIDADGTSCGDGTSYAAPIVAGISTHLVEKNSTHMAPWPELQRAVLMATADENVDGSRLEQLPDSSTDHRDGAGEVDARKAVDLASSSYKKDGGNTACPKGFDMTFLQSSTTSASSYYSEEYKMKTTESGKRARVVITWDGTATCSNPATGTCSGATEDANLDLVVTAGGSSWVSDSADNTYEFLEFDVTAYVEYTIKIYVYDWTTSSTFVGLAWYIDDFDS